MGVSAYLGVGSNQGDRLHNLQRAVDLLHRRPGVRVVRCSRVYETDPVGGPPQGDYLNAVVEVDTMLTPSDLLGACAEVENVLGRVRTERWGPRVIDVDILTYGDQEVSMESPRLEIPHPRMHERMFVLAPSSSSTRIHRSPAGGGSGRCGSLPRR